MSNRARFLVLVLTGAIALDIGCGSNDKTVLPPSELMGIEITPSDHTLVIEGAAPATAEYKARGMFADGSTADITDQVQFTIDNPQLGTFDGAELTTGTSAGGHTRVYAWLDDVMGVANLTVRLQKRYSDPDAGDLPADPGGLFDGPAAPERAPTLLYPSDGVMVPPNLRKLEFHFDPGQDTSIFEIAYSSDTTDIKVYTRCVVPLNGGCIYTPDASVWSWIAESNRGAGELSVTVRGTDEQGTAVGESEPISVLFSRDDIQGALYYWTTSQAGDSETAIMRFDFASPTQTEGERFIGTEMTGGYCVGCHALSRSGDRLLTASNSSYNAYVLLVDVGTRMPVVPFNSTPRSAFSAWNPDGTRYVGVFADEQEDGFISYDLNVFDGNSGEFIETIDVGGTEDHPTTHPDWSPDGQRIAYTHVGHVPPSRLSNGTLALVEQTSLRMVTRTEDGTWSQPVELTSSVKGQGTFYPAFSPEGDLLVFNESVCSDGENGRDCDAYDDPGASLYVMMPEPGAPAIELSAANAPGVTDTSLVQNSYPKWAPFTFQRSGEFGSRLHWLTFSSNRNYGLRTPAASQTLIWMVAVNPDAALQGRDPSFAAFALPFQDIHTDNHTAQWTERAIAID